MNRAQCATGVALSWNWFAAIRGRSAASSISRTETTQILQRKSLCQIAVCRKFGVEHWGLIVVLGGGWKRLSNSSEGNKANIVIAGTQTCLPIYLLSFSLREETGVERAEVGVTMTNQTSYILHPSFLFLCCFCCKAAPSGLKLTMQLW